MKNTLIASAAAAALSIFASPAFASNVVDIYGTFTDSVSGVTAGDNAPTIVQNGLQSTKYFNVDNLTQGGSAGYAVGDTNGTLFTVDPASCIKGTKNCSTTAGTETANINITLSFYNSTGGLIGTASDTAVATFNYFSNTSKDDDNLCWQNSLVGGSAVVSEKLVGSCGAPGTGLQTAYEQIEVNLNGSYYDVNLYDWNDWNETPSISFASIAPPARKVPEPTSFALLAAGLLGLGFVVTRRRQVKPGVA